MICENCGKPLENNNTVIDAKEDGSVHLFCRNCVALFGTCAMCAHTYCGFSMIPTQRRNSKWSHVRYDRVMPPLLSKNKYLILSALKNSAWMVNANAFSMTPNIHSAAVMVVMQLAQIIVRKKSTTLFKIFL